MIEITAAISGTWCDVEATHRTDDHGPYTDIYIATTDGYPMYEAFIDGHAALPTVHAAIEELASGRPTTRAEWTDLRRSQVA